MTPIELALAVVGASVLYAYPVRGPTAFVRERLVRPVAKRLRAEELCDCLKCIALWTGLGVGLYNDCWWVALIAPALAWAGLQFTGGKINSR